VSVPSIGVRSGLQPLGLLKDGSLAPPTKWQVAGWYAKGVLPGQIGPAVIAGHVDSTRGPAIFYRLRDVKVGDRVVVTEHNGKSLTFVVDHTNIYRKSRFPTSVVYGPTPDPQLRLVTCTGDFDASKRSYVDNLVVSAHLVS
jgi:LPXTG-site transpeptidase (sortase) family protein